MITVPDRLLSLKEVSILGRWPDLTVLYKRLNQSSYNRQCYLNQFVCSIILKGQQVIQLEDEQTIKAKAGDILFLRAGIYNITDLIMKDGSFHSIHFFTSKELLSSQLSYHNQPQEALQYQLIQGNQHISIFTQNLLAHHDLPHPFTHQLMLNKFMELMEYIKFTNPHLDSQLATLLPQKPLNLRSFMERNVFHPFTVSDYARISGRSESSFRREFRLKFGTTPKNWLINERMNKARQLLTAGQTSISDLALQCGYDNVPHFITSFKRKFGLTPGQLKPELSI